MVGCVVCMFSYGCFVCVFVSVFVAGCCVWFVVCCYFALYWFVAVVGLVACCVCFVWLCPVRCLCLIVYFSCVVF